MIEIVNLTNPSNNEENKLNSSFDQARRFEWRLQWEKSQLENWQAYQSLDFRSDSDKAKEAGKLSTTDINSLGYDSIETPGLRKVNKQYITTYTASSGETKTVNARVQLASKNSLLINNSSETVLKRTTVIGKQTTTTQSYINTYLQYKKPTTKNMHIYRHEGCVEIALRDKAIKSKRAIELLENIKNDLAKQGLYLTRLKLNGNVVINSTHGVTSEPVSVRTENSPINRTY
ncbi:hypothetical protein A3197_17320 [Candidatus Thiodiazotropha endoloripes]|nr:hypothetical protein A3197_17320 [Candidatus Thiodiazotropha endoloripes]